MFDRLDKAEPKVPAKQKRTAPRVVFRKNDVAVRIYHPGGTSTASFVSTRNLSQGGVAFLYQGFLHRGTKIDIVLRRRLGGDDLVRGLVTQCDLVKSAYHLVGVKFEQPIFPKLYIDPSEWGELDEHTTIDPATLTGKVLHLDDQEMDRVLLAHFLKGTKIELTSVGTLPEALEAVKKTQFNCFLCDLMLDGTTGEHAITEMRKSGFAGPIAMVTAETSAARLNAARDAGAGAILTKPYDAQKLQSLMSTWLNAADHSNQAIYSSMASNDQMIPLIEQFARKVHSLADDLQRLAQTEHLEPARNICQTLKGTGGGFGFSELSDVAKEAVQSIDATCSLEESSMQIQRLVTICRRITPGTPPPK